MQPSAAARMHVALNVTDLAASIDFYRRALGREPAKQRADYAKFELSDPPLVLSLNPLPAGAAPRGGQTLSHLGIRVADAASLEAVRSRLEAAGLPAREERDVVCCYATQDKLWVRDPDGNEWEFYELLADAEQRYPGEGACCATPAEPKAASCCA
jgi:catechol 2,3-dioxygenase-like lactoylglutathione lyase family enzyme